MASTDPERAMKNNDTSNDKYDNDDKNKQKLSSPETYTASQRRTSVTFVQSADDPALHKPRLQRTPTPFHEICLSQPESPSSFQDGGLQDDENKNVEDDDSETNVGGSKSSKNKDGKIVEEYHGIRISAPKDYKKCDDGMTDESLR